MRNIAQIHATKANGGNSLVAANVRAELGYANLAQSALAPVLGISGMAVSRRLSDQTEFTASEIVALADFFEITPGELFTNRAARKTKKAPTPKSEGQRLPRLDSNQQPAGSQPAAGIRGIITPITPTPTEACDQNAHNAVITKLHA